MKIVVVDFEVWDTHIFNEDCHCIMNLPKKMEQKNNVQLVDQLYIFIQHFAIYTTRSAHTYIGTTVPIHRVKPITQRHALVRAPSDIVDVSLMFSCMRLTSNMQVPRLTWELAWRKEKVYFPSMPLSFLVQ